MNFQSFQEKILSLGEGSPEFDELALALYQFQSKENPLYAQYLQLTGQSGFSPQKLQEIPFLPIGFFKTGDVFCQGFSSQLRFASSGTGGNRSRHLIADSSFCAAVSHRAFLSAIGDISNCEILALLPGYEENPESSLIFMVKSLEKSSAAEVRFFGLNFLGFGKAIEDCRERGHQPLVFGVSHAFLSLLESGFMPDLSDVILIETGGMKGLRREISKMELLEILQNELQPGKLISEFGMCELLSQAYAFPERYQPAASLRACIRQPEDPLASVSKTGRGVLNFIDLANYASCAFIASEDLGTVYEDGSFSILGRLDQAEIRGCNLLFA
jgi:hypothetical protein